MAKQLTSIPSNITEYPNSFKRQGAFPLEAYEVFYSKTEADYYAINSPLAYVGQKITVVEEGKSTLYLIQPPDGEHPTSYLDKIEGVGGPGGTIVYLNTQELIGEHLELSDVYPIQSSDSSLNVVSKNRVDYSTLFEHYFIGNNVHTDDTGMTMELGSNVYDVTEYDDTEPFIKVYGTTTKNIETTIELGTVVFNVQGKYTISLHNYNGVIDTTAKKCYITYQLEDGDGNIVQTSKILTDDHVTIDTKELNCMVARFNLYIKMQSGQTMSEQPFNLQVEFGDVATTYSHPRSSNYCSNKSVSVYGRNLVDPNQVFTNGVKTPLYNSNGERTSALTTIPTVGTVAGITYKVEDLGVHYIRGTMTDDNDISINTNIILKTPLLSGDSFTLIFNVTSLDESLARISDVQVVYSHTEYEEYLPYEVETVISGMYSYDPTSCDISKLKYPYSFVSINNFDGTTNGLAVQLKYDPALSRNWTEKQLKKIDDRLGELESILPTERTYIEEHNIIDNSDGTFVYYEKWSNGVIKYHASCIVPSATSDRTNVTFNVNVPKEHCQSIITCNVSGFGSMGAGTTTCELKQITSNSTNYVVGGVFNSVSSGEQCTVYVSVVGRWK